MTVPPYPTNPAEQQPRPAGPAPQEVETAFRLLIASVVIGLLGSLLSLPNFSSLVDETVKASNGTVTEATARTGIIVGLVIGLVILALYLFFVFQMRKGKNWARITLTVLGALNVVFTLIGFASASALVGTGALGLLNVLISVVGALLVVAAIYFMFRPAANAYFTAPTYR